MDTQEQDTGRDHGLSSETARKLLAEVGPNEPAPVRRRSEVVEFLRLFLNPLVLILLIAAGLSGLLGQKADSAIIAIIVLVSVGLDFEQNYRSQRAVEGLRQQVAPTATVLRDRVWRDIPRREVVPGDLIRLSAGDLVPADSRLISSRDLYVQQAALTGESLPTEKSAKASSELAGPESPNLVFLGTSVVSGTGTAVVLATGASTAFGDIASLLEARPEETEFDRGLRDFSLLLTRAVLFLVLFLIVVSVALHRNLLESLLFAVALAVGLTPEFLPMITALTLSNGAVAMARKKVIVKHLSSIQNLGSIDILCSDKTGTLTSGKMVLERWLDPLGNVSNRALTLACLNSKFETGIRSPLDAAILQHDCPEVEAYIKCDEIPFDFERRRLSIVVRAGEETLLITKGAPEGVLERSVAYEQDGRTLPLDAAVMQRARETLDRLSGDGFRVLAVAWGRVDGRTTFTADDEHDLVLAGFLSFSDPALPDAAEAVAAMESDGVEVKIITGDSDLVTAHLCARVGLDAGRPVAGQDLLAMTDGALGHVAEQATVFARVSPAQKNRIIHALQHRGHTVGFIGDGINDAPSLHAADVGVSVSTAVDVARDAADIILVEPGLHVLHDGIMEGRKAFGNVMKYLLMGTSSNFGNMLSMAGASLFLPFLPMLPTQILLNNFLYDLAQITIPGDHVDEEYLGTPQHWDIRLIRRFMLLIGPISSLFDFLTFYVLLHVFHAGEAEFHTGWFVESLATQTLVLFVIRTMKNPFKSLPSRALSTTTIGVVVIGALLPITPLAGPLGFTPLRRSYFAFLAVATTAYLLMVEMAKRRLMGKHIAS